MIFWSLAHLRGRPLVMSAIVMGVLATSFTRFMPDLGIEGMKVGPGLVRLRAVELLGGRGQVGRLPDPECRRPRRVPQDGLPDDHRPRGD